MYNRVRALAGIAGTQAKAGNIAGARQALQQAERTAEGIVDFESDPYVGDDAKKAQIQAIIAEEQIQFGDRVGAK